MKSLHYPSLSKIPLSLVFNALSDPIRLEILFTLMNKPEISCGSCKSALSKSTMSHHFKVLTQAGLIKKREHGKVHYLSIRKSEIEKRIPGLLEMLESANGPI
jgi:DNA-binding transcriptional ArsR family regulator